MKERERKCARERDREREKESEQASKRASEQASERERRRTYDSIAKISVGTFALFLDLLLEVIYSIPPNAQLR